MKLWPVQWSERRYLTLSARRSDNACSRWYSQMLTESDAKEIHFGRARVRCNGPESGESDHSGVSNFVRGCAGRIRCRLVLSFTKLIR